MHITEILPDLDKMPAWAKEAFEAGQFFDVAFKLVGRLQRERDIAVKGITDWQEGNYPHPRSHGPQQCPHDVHYYETCDACDGAHFQSVLDKLEKL